MSHCSKQHCPAEGEYYAVLCVPAKRASRNNPLRALLSMPLCATHYDDLNAEDFLGPDVRASLRVQLMQRGKAQPDFSRVWKERGRIGDEHWRAFQSAMGAGR